MSGGPANPLAAVDRHEAPADDRPESATAESRGAPGHSGRTSPATADRGVAPLHAVEIDIAPDHPAFDGHFPGHPLLPGVVLLAEVLEAAAAEPALAARIGSAPRMAQVKFLGAVAPGARLSIHFADARGGLRFDVRIVTPEGERDAASGLVERTRAADAAAAQALAAGTSR